MNFLRRLRMPKFNFSAVKTDLRSTLPLRSGGIYTLPRSDVINYYRLVLSNIPPKPADCKDETVNMIPEVRYFYETVKKDPILRMCCQGALDTIDKKPTTQGSMDYDGCMVKLFEAVSSVCITPPIFRPTDIVGVPFYALFIDFLNTPFGEAFFANPIVNVHLKNVFDAYNNMLMSAVSLKHLNEEKNGWFSPAATTEIPEGRTEPYWNPNDYILNKN